jgi:hypothetical protein
MVSNRKLPFLFTSGARSELAEICRTRRSRPAPNNNRVGKCKLPSRLVERRLFGGLEPALPLPRATSSERLGRQLRRAYSTAFEVSTTIWIEPAFKRMRVQYPKS